MQQVLTCANCGSQNSANQQFCNNCGARLSEVASPQKAMPQQPAQQQSKPMQQQWQPAQQSQPMQQQSQQMETQQAQLWSTQVVQRAAATQTKEKLATQPRKYVLLGVAVIIFRIVGWVVLVGGILSSIAVALLTSQGAMPGVVDLMDRGMALIGVSGVAGAGLAVLVVVGIIWSLLMGLGLLAFAELSSAVMVIDESTRGQK